MTKSARLFLYLMVAVLMLAGLAGVFAPSDLSSQLKLAALAPGGFSELRGLMGGGFIGFALCLMFGLRPSPLAPGFLLAIGLIMLLIAFGRVVSLLLDGVDASALTAGLGELLIAVCCWRVARAS